MTNASKPEERAGDIIGWDQEDRPLVPDDPVIPYIEGDGIGPDIWSVTRTVLDAAVSYAYSGKKRIVWREVLVGERARAVYGRDDLLPEESLDTIRRCGIAIKGPLTTPVGGGFRSLNVALRQVLDLYACVRPVRHMPGVPAPVRYPERMNVILFRENTEDVYAGLEWPAGAASTKKIIGLINQIVAVDKGRPVSSESGIGIKPMSRQNTQRLVAMAIRYALENHRESVTLVHKGNIMKYTEGAFRDWGYQLAAERFPDHTITEKALYDEYGGIRPHNRVVIKDRIADAMFQQLLLRPEEYDVIAAPNLNGDYLSDAAAAQVGGLGMAPGANIGTRCALFEATHGTAPKYAGLDKVNPGSLILSGVEMLRFMTWHEAADLVLSAMEKTIQEGTVTYDLARQMEGATEVKCSQFGKRIVDNMKPDAPAIH